MNKRPSFILREKLIEEPSHSIVQCTSLHSKCLAESQKGVTTF